MQQDNLRGGENSGGAETSRAEAYATIRSTQDVAWCSRLIICRGKHIAKGVLSDAVQPTVSCLM